MKALLIFFVIPFVALCQKENQFLTSQKGIFIEQNNKGKFGIVKSNGEILVPIVNEYIKELRQGSGFIVFEKIIEGPGDVSGIVRFYDKTFKDVYKETFSKIIEAGSEELICYDGYLCGVMGTDGNVIAPICFSKIIPMGGGVFWFDAEDHLRKSLPEILKTKSISEEQMPENVSSVDKGGYLIFQGVFNQKGELLCKGQCRIVEIVQANGEQSLFAVQNDQQFHKNEGVVNVAIMNGKGELVSDYVYSEVINVDGQLIGEIVTDAEFKRIPLNEEGKPKK